MLNTLYKWERKHPSLDAAIWWIVGLALAVLVLTPWF